MTDLHTLAKTRNIYLVLSSIFFASIPTTRRPFATPLMDFGIGLSTSIRAVAKLSSTICRLSSK